MLFTISLSATYVIKLYSLYFVITLIFYYVIKYKHSSSQKSKVIISLREVEALSVKFGFILFNSLNISILA